MLSKKLRFAISFAKFVQNHHLNPNDLASLIVLTDKAVAASVRECNGGKNADPAREQFEKKAKELGFSGVCWNGLTPSVLKGTEELYLPTASN